MIHVDTFSLKRKAAAYKEVLQNTLNYRQVWSDQLKDQIKSLLEELATETELNATVEIRAEVENLEAIVLSLGQSKSGMYQKVNEDYNRHLIKYNGALVYQQLFNGKIIVLINYPYIENYGQPQPPKTIAIYRPEEIKEPFILRHMEELLSEVTKWEDYDDDNEPVQRIGFNLNFNPTAPAPEEQ